MCHVTHYHINFIFAKEWSFFFARKGEQRKQGYGAIDQEATEQ